MNIDRIVASVLFSVIVFLRAEIAAVQPLSDSEKRQKFHSFVYYLLFSGYGYIEKAGGRTNFCVDADWATR